MRLAETTQGLLRDAATLARRRGDASWDSRHLVSAMRETTVISAALTPTDLFETEPVAVPAQTDAPAQPTGEVRELLIHARWLAAFDGRSTLEPKDLALAVFWDAHCRAGRAARRDGIGFETAYRELVGGDPPPCLAPDPDPVTIDADDLARVQVNLKRLVPEGVAYGFERAGPCAVLWSTREDFSDLVERAVAMDDEP